MRILIAEDDLTSRLMLASVLKKGGHEVVETANGAEAWDRLQAPGAPPLIILDWMMPEMDGLEVMRMVRAMENENPPYIIMLTARGEKADIISGLDAGANDYLSKPFDAGELRARVQVGCRMIEMQEALIESRKALAHQASHDPLTGLLNRRAILDNLERELRRAERLGEWLAIGIFDIDRFKLINDTYGHQTGDDVLCGFCQILEGNLRIYDSVGRWGGEEFLVITPVKAETNPVCIFDRLRMRVAESPITTRSGGLSITVSIGVACFTPGSTVDELLGAADSALYRAKDQGRNCTVHACELTGEGLLKCAS